MEEETMEGEWVNKKAKEKKARIRKTISKE